MTWRDAVLASLHAYSARHATRVVRRGVFRDEELSRIVAATGATGATPWQTMSRVFQGLRDEGLVELLTPGSYLLLDTPIDAESEPLSNKAIDFAILAGRLRMGRVQTGVSVGQARRRRGQARLRQLSPAGYGGRCAVCDVSTPDLLVASHIVRWADAPDHRGDLQNVLSLCRFHDTLFERGDWSLADDYVVLTRPTPAGQVVTAVLAAVGEFRPPTRHPPAATFLREHRRRTGFEV